MEVLMFYTAFSRLSYIHVYCVCFSLVDFITKHCGYLKIDYHFLFRIIKTCYLKLNLALQIPENTFMTNAVTIITVEKVTKLKGHKHELEPSVEASNSYAVCLMRCTNLRRRSEVEET